MGILISLENVSFSYQGEDPTREQTLKEISLKVEEGEFLAIVGANGSGKSTLARHLNGLILPDKGRLLVCGLDTRTAANTALIRQRVGMVFQSPEEQVLASTVEEDVAFGPENVGMPSAVIRKRVDEAIEAVSLQAHRRRPPHLLSAGQMQRLALAGVLAMEPRVVVFDEATSMLDPAGRRKTLAMMRDLQKQGLAVIFITHHMEEAIQADRVLVLSHGEMVFDGPPLNLFVDPALGKWGLETPPELKIKALLEEMWPEARTAGLDLNQTLARIPQGNHPGDGAKPAVGLPDQESDAYICVRDLDHSYLLGTPLEHRALTGANMTARRRRMHALAGSTGSGKSTLLQHLNGLLRPQSGSVRVGELRLEDERVSTSQAVRQAGLAFQNPETQFFNTYVGDEIAYGPRMLELAGSLREHVREAMDLVGLDFETYKDRTVYSLSGGERRKVALASVIANRTPILLLDEPTAGLDPVSHREIMEKLKLLASGGRELVISSHRMDDLAEICEDISVFRKGTDLYDGPITRFFSDTDLVTEAGLEQPVAARTAQALREKGWSIDEGVIRLEQLEQALSQMEGTA